jgi:hypothetical protein
LRSGAVLGIIPTWRNIKGGFIRAMSRLECG